MISKKILVWYNYYRGHWKSSVFEGDKDIYFLFIIIFFFNLRFRPCSPSWWNMIFSLCQASNAKIFCRCVENQKFSVISNSAAEFCTALYSLPTGSKNIWFQRPLLSNTQLGGGRMRNISNLPVIIYRYFFN